MSALVFILLALVAGACLPTQAGINAQLNLWARSPVLTAAISFAVGTLSLAAYALITRIPIPEISSASKYPAWIWLGGCLGAFFVFSTTVLAPRLGATTMVALIVAGQMTAGVFLDHFGLIGYTPHPVNLWRMTGVGLMVGGVVLVRWF
jgi:bacterial/archaeal transporter family-2 protein